LLQGRLKKSNTLRSMSNMDWKWILLILILNEQNDDGIEN
jgi:hypothetical protein